jgi:predicted porin
MKKSLLALAVLGAFAGAASAQSSVTIYGLLDLAVTKGNGGTANGDSNPGANGTSKAYIMKQSASSRLGFRGTEDLGGGMSAQFQIEHRFTPDDGAAAGTFWAGRSYVQLTSAAVGSVYLGREYTPAFWPAVKTDPFGWDGVGQVSFGQYAKFRSASSSIRTANTAGFRSASFGGVTVQAAVGLGEGQATVGRDVGGNLEYSAGPVYAGVGFEKITNDPSGAQNGNQIVNFGASYDLGFIKPIVYFASTKTGANGVNANKDMMFALTAPIGAGKLKFAINRMSPDTTPVGAVATGKQTHIGIGYDYALSKRTGVYVDFGRGSEDQGKLAVKPTNNTAAAVGVKHTF